MKCQKCGINPATINMAMQMNDEKIQLHVCNDCFQDIQNEIQNQGFFQGDDIFSNPFFQGASNGQAQGQSRTRTKQKQNAGEKDGLIDEIGTNVTDQARQGEIDPVIGRDNEVKRAIETLNRRNKNNPVLIGEPGVGKTAIAEGLALRVGDGDVLGKVLIDEVYVVDVAAGVASPGVLGQSEGRMKEVSHEMKEGRDAVVCIVDLHLLVGAGTAEGADVDAGNILLPALGR